MSLPPHVPISPRLLYTHSASLAAESATRSEIGLFAWAAAALLPVLLLPPPPADMTDVARTLSVSAVTAIIGYISTSLLNLRAQR